LIFVIKSFIICFPKNEINNSLLFINFVLFFSFVFQMKKNK
jgi:hypothetical protein